MDNERTADVLQVALASYDRKELRVQKNYLEEQNPVLACTCFLNGHKLLQELQQGHNFDIVVLCSQMEDMSSIEFMMELRKLEHKPLLMLFDEGRRKNSSALRMEDSGSCCCVERMELKNLLRELYRMPEPTLRPSSISTSCAPCWCGSCAPCPSAATRTNKPNKTKNPELPVRQEVPGFVVE